MDLAEPQPVGATKTADETDIPRHQRGHDPEPLVGRCVDEKIDLGPGRHLGGHGRAGGDDLIGAGVTIDYDSGSDGQVETFESAERTLQGLTADVGHGDAFVSETQADRDRGADLDLKTGVGALCRYRSRRNRSRENTWILDCNLHSEVVDHSSGILHRRTSEVGNGHGSLVHGKNQRKPENDPGYREKDRQRKQSSRHRSAL